VLIVVVARIILIVRVARVAQGQKKLILPVDGPFPGLVLANLVGIVMAALKMDNFVVRKI
jgi:hypothetical protein